MNHRDVEQLSAYLDGQLNPSDSARLETRLASDLALASALDALRESRSLLRRMPKRRAPRNFLLTPKMVGIKPPLPRAYPIFRFATVLATLLFAFSFLNIRPIPLGASAPMPEYGIGGGGGAEATEAPMAEMAVVTEAPVAEPSVATEPPAAVEQSPTEMALNVPAPEASPSPAEDANRIAEEPASPKSAGETPPARPLFTQWQIAFGAIALLGAASMFIIQRLAARKWRAK